MMPIESWAVDEARRLAKLHPNLRPSQIYKMLVDADRDRPGLRAVIVRAAGIIAEVATEIGTSFDAAIDYCGLVLEEDEADAVRARHQG